MSGFELLQQPHFPVVTIESDAPIIPVQLLEKLEGEEGITLCVRSEHGEERRGGYFFCIARGGDDYFALESMEGEHIDDVDINTLVTFINHASGRKFNKAMLVYCQNFINFRED